LPPPPPPPLPTAAQAPFIPIQFSPQSAAASAATGQFSFQTSPQLCFLSNGGGGGNASSPNNSMGQPQAPHHIQYANSNLNTSMEQYPIGDPTEWNCDEVCQFVKCVAGAQVANLFKAQEVDGSALNLIRDDHLVSTMQIKLGPALKIMSKFNELKGKHIASAKQQQHLQNHHHHQQQQQQQQH
jgi:hypothetical protein